MASNNTEQTPATPATPVSDKVTLKPKASMPSYKDVSKRWMYVAGGAIALVVTVSTLMSGNNKPVAKPKEEAAIDLTPKGIQEKSSWQMQSQSDIRKLADKLEALESKNRKLEEELSGKSGKSTSGFGGPNPLTVPPIMLKNSGDNVPVPPPVPLPPVPPKVEGAATVASPTPTVSQPAPVVMDAPKKLAFIAPASSEVVDVPKDDVKSKMTFKENKFAGYLPAGAFAESALLHGLDAGTSATVQSNPQPVLLRIQDNAVLPGASRYQLKSCFTLGSAYGDLSSERVYVRLGSLSCTDREERLVLSMPVKGYVVDSDGKLGLRGKLVDRQGAKLGKALLAGFAQGMASVATAGMSTTTTSAFGAVSTLTGADAAKTAGLTGANTAANQLAQFYLKQAESVFPVITVEAARTGTIVFSEGVSLAWQDTSTLYKKELMPQTQSVPAPQQ